MPALAESKRRAEQVAARLGDLYPAAECALNFRSPLQLLVATILSAQCTDVRVNIVTRDLFKKYRTAQDFAEAPAAELEQAIRSTGFYKNKAKNIQTCCRSLVERHGGEVPETLDELVQLAGVGRKTANVVLGTGFGIASGVVVDTHVTRLTHRLGLTRKTDAVKIEHDLMKLLPPEEWVDFSHRLIWHGRGVCTARKPHCEACGLEPLCPKIGVAPPRARSKNAAKQASGVKPKSVTATASKSKPKRTTESRR